MDRYIEKIVEIRNPAQLYQQPKPRSVAEAIERILALREASSLDGLSTKNLINEGRKY